MLSDKEIEEVWRESSNGGYCNLVKIDFARAVESAVLRKAVEMAGKAWLSHRPCSLCNDAGYKVAISALEGRWKP